MYLYTYTYVLMFGRHCSFSNKWPKLATLAENKRLLASSPKAPEDHVPSHMWIHARHPPWFSGVFNMKVVTVEPSGNVHMAIHGSKIHPEQFAAPSQKP